MSDPIFPRPGVDPESVDAWLTAGEYAGERPYRDMMGDLSASRREVHSLRVQALAAADKLTAERDLLQAGAEERETAMFDRMEGQLAAALLVTGLDPKDDGEPSWDALVARAGKAATEIARLRGMLATCFKLTGEDPGGDEDWRIAERAAAEVRRLREAFDKEELATEVAEAGAEGIRRQLVEAHAEISAMRARLPGDGVAEHPRAGTCAFCSFSYYLVAGGVVVEHPDRDAKPGTNAKCPGGGWAPKESP